MKIYAQVWCDFNPRLHLKFDRSHGRASALPGDRLHRVNPLSIRGVQLACQLSESIPESSVTVFSIGEGHREALVKGMAAGAQNGIRLMSPAPAISDQRLTASALAEWFRKHQNTPDILIGDRMCAITGFHLGMQHVAGLETVSLTESGIAGCRPSGRGAREKVYASLPVAIRLTGSQLSPKYINRDRIKMFRDTDFPESELSVSGLSAQKMESGPSLAPFRPRTRKAKKMMDGMGGRKGMERFQALLSGKQGKPGAGKQPVSTDAGPENSAEKQAEELIRYLCHHELLNLREESP